MLSLTHSVSRISKDPGWLWWRPGPCQVARDTDLATLTWKGPTKGCAPDRWRLFSPGSSSGNFLPVAIRGPKLGSPAGAEAGRDKRWRCPPNAPQGGRGTLLLWGRRVKGGSRDRMCLPLSPLRLAGWAQPGWSTGLQR